MANVIPAPIMMGENIWKTCYKFQVHGHLGAHHHDGVQERAGAGCDGMVCPGSGHLEPDQGQRVDISHPVHLHIALD